MEERGIMECRREEDLGHAGQMLPLSLRGDWRDYSGWPELKTTKPLLHTGNIRVSQTCTIFMNKKSLFKCVAAGVLFFCISLSLRTLKLKEANLISCENVLWAPPVIWLKTLLSLWTQWKERINAEREGRDQLASACHVCRIKLSRSACHVWQLLIIIHSCAWQMSLCSPTTDTHTHMQIIWMQLLQRQQHASAASVQITLCLRLWCQLCWRKRRLCYFSKRVCFCEEESHVWQTHSDVTVGHYSFTVESVLHSLHMNSNENLVSTWTECNDWSGVFTCEPVLCVCTSDCSRSSSLLIV